MKIVRSFFRTGSSIVQEFSTYIRNYGTTLREYPIVVSIGLQTLFKRNPYRTLLKNQELRVIKSEILIPLLGVVASGLIGFGNNNLQSTLSHRDLGNLRPVADSISGSIKYTNNLLFRLSAFGCLAHGALGLSLSLKSAITRKAL